MNRHQFCTKEGYTMDLKECRERLDEIDKEIVELYEKRMDICALVAQDKIKTGKKIFDRERELSKLENVKKLASDEFRSHGVEELFIQLMSMSRKLQYRILEENGIKGRLSFIGLDDLELSGATVVYQGTEGAYSQQAMHAFFGENVRSFNVGTFREAMLAIYEGNADFGVLPIENSSAGIVSENYDLLVDFENYIVAEQIIDIDHCLLGLGNSSEDMIKTVYSHEQALRQCSEYLSTRKDVKTVSYPNTALAAKKILEDGDVTQGAIAGEKAAQIHGLKVLKKSINFSNRNRTRFIIVTNQKIYKKTANKISMCFEIPHESGSLYRILSNFIYNDINMNRIESRPLPDRPWEYRFFIDIDGNLADPGVKNAIRGIREETKNMKVLGCYYSN